MIIEWYEYAIEWTSPADIAGSITEFRRDLKQAQLILRLSWYSEGHIVIRHHTMSDWKTLKGD